MSPVLIILAFASIFALTILVYICFDKNNSLKAENSELKAEIQKTKKDKEEILSINVGDKALVHRWGLEWTKTKKSFYINYEVEVIEVSTNKVKVKGIDYTSDDDEANKSHNKQGILHWMDNTWLDKSRIELILDTTRAQRDNKLTQILN